MIDDGHTDADIGIGTLLGGRYLLEQRIGRGGMADVFRGVDGVLHRSVAVKVFRFDATAGDDRRRVDAEIRTVASLRHPGLVTVFDAGTVDEPDGDGTPFLVMELITGPTLNTQLADGPLGPAQTAVIGAELAVALRYVHASGVVHRDVKPANILLDTPTGGGPGFSAKLSDFGIARLIDSARLTVHGMTIGTANYLSPEQAESGAASPASDVYSLGLVLVECLTGQIAYPGVGVEAAIARLQRPPVVPREFGPQWAQLLTAMTARVPADRPSTSDVAATLGAFALPQTNNGPTEAMPDVTQVDDTVAFAGSVLTAAVPADQQSATTMVPHAERPFAAHRSGRIYLAAAAALTLLVAVVVAFLVLGTTKSGTPTAKPSYPAVTGQLGTDLTQLEAALP